MDFGIGIVNGTYFLRPKWMFLYNITVCFGILTVPVIH